LYEGLPLYAFADNHDVHRVASNLTNTAHLYPLYFLMFTMPGVPSIYYGSEWGITGKKRRGNDRYLRPALTLDQGPKVGLAPDLEKTIAQLARVRKSALALRHGDYRALHVSHEQLAFARRAAGQEVVVMLNASQQPAAFDVPFSAEGISEMVDLLNPDERFSIVDGRLKVKTVWPTWGRVLV
jgi:glycosidase